MSITTTVPEYLVHGFLDEQGSTNFLSATSVSNAFAQEGVVLNYAIKTNTVADLVVTATLTPFTKLGDENATVGIESLSVGSELKVPDSGTYRLVDLISSNQGMRLYSYTLTVKANQNDVAVAANGNYESTLSISILQN
ncbi:hypothetical protein [uncultured Sphaerochaeta sp.]|uniref:hypothetical protein n=1 Tax=uncultured Sphaerochaeta sp. TaxID=886478 RepID=UPI002A0A87F8|nr:hypothetical protein [uncultured Sphaerochaeta sp.]